jgi:protein-tyrosine phosphatase
MTYKSLFSCLTLVLVLPSCTDNSPNIVAVCERNKVGNYVIKWEAPSRIKGKVKTYASTNPDLIPPRNPVAIANISDQRLTIVINNPTRRYYYLMVFDNRYRIKIADRNIDVPGIQNLYDIGGYKLNNREKNVKWGKLYRADEIRNLNRYALNKLKNTGIKTIINLDAVSKQKEDFLKDAGFNAISIPIITIGKQIYNDLQKKEIVNNDNARKRVDYINREFITKYQPEYKRIFDVLLDKTNYPVMFHCSSDKGCAAIVSLLILTSLGVNAELITEDYRLNDSNSVISSKFTSRFPANPKRAINTYEEELLNNFKKQIEKEHRSINAYLKKEIGLTEENITALKGLLLE